MVVADGLANAPRAAVEHEPQASLVVGLELDEVVPAPQRADLEAASLLLRASRDGALSGRASRSGGRRLPALRPWRANGTAR